jgi:hypothetical protein
MFIYWIMHGCLAAIPFITPVITVAVAKLDATTRADFSISSSSIRCRQSKTVDNLPDPFLS